MVGEQGVVRDALLNVVEGAALHLLLQCLRQQLLQSLGGQHHRGWQEGWERRGADGVRHYQITLEYEPTTEKLKAIS